MWDVLLNLFFLCSYGGGGGGDLSVLIIIPIVLGIVILFCVCYLWAKSSEEEEMRRIDASTSSRATSAAGTTGTTSSSVLVTGETTPCYLCLARIEQPAWDSGSHRKACAQRRAGFLFNLPMPHPIRCPKCNKMLLLWPDRGPQVYLYKNRLSLKTYSIDTKK